MAAGKMYKKRYLAIQDGLMRERVDETQANEFDCLSHVHLVDISFRDVKKKDSDEVIGEVIQLHLKDADDYFIVETWNNGAYAKSFYNLMQSIDLNSEFHLITSQKIKQGKKKPALFIKQHSQNLQWSHTKDNMKDCPPAKYTELEGGKWDIDDEAQMDFFMNLILTEIIPVLKKKTDPFPAHPSNEVLAKQKQDPFVFPVKPVEAAKNAAGEHTHSDAPDAVDDLPF